MDNSSSTPCITISGPAHDMPKWPEYSVIDDLMASLVPGEEVWLYAEPDNPYDPCAIECWLRGRRAGYVKATEAPAVQLLLREGMLRATVLSTDGHKTYFVAADDPEGVLAGDTVMPAATLPASLLPPGLRLNEKAEERRFDILCARMFAELDRRNAAGLLAAMEEYEAAEGQSFCREEMMAWHRFEHRIGPFLDETAVQTLPEYPRMRAIYNKVTDRHHDYCATSAPLRLYTQLITRAMEGADDEEGLLTLYRARALGFRDDMEHLSAAREELVTWLDKATDGFFSSTLARGDVSGFARRLYYASYARRDLLMLAAHVVVWQRLCRDTFTIPLPDPDKTSQTLCREDQIRAFMHRLDPFVSPGFQPVVDMIINNFVNVSSNLTREVRRRIYPFFERVDEELIPEIGDFSYNAAADVLGELVKLELYTGRLSKMGAALGVNSNIRNHISKGLELRCPQAFNIIYQLNEYAIKLYPYPSVKAKSTAPDEDCS